MKAPQGIILMMFATLILWLTWSARSPLRGTGSSPSTSTNKPTPSNPSGDTIKVKPGGGITADNTPHFPVIPAEILGPYAKCKTDGGTWDFTQSKCLIKA